MIVWASLSREDRLAYVKPLWLDGKSALEISKSLDGATRNAIIGYICRNGLQRHDGGITARLAGRASKNRIGKADRPAPNTGGARKVAAIRAQAKAFGETRVKPAYAISSNGQVIEKSAGHAPRATARDRAFTPLQGCEPVPFASAGCKWPVGGSGAAMAQCGAKRGSGSYCATHADIASSKWQPAPEQDVAELKWRLPGGRKSA